MIGLILINEPLVATLFDRGRFAEVPDAVARVGFALSMYALGIWAYGMNHLLVRAFYALQEARIPMRISLINVVLNVTLNLILVQTPLREAGLALATSICAALQTLMLLFFLNRRIGGFQWTPFVSSLLRTCAATIGMGASVWGLGALLAEEMSAPLRLGILVLTGGITYPLCAILSGSRELREAISRGRSGPEPR
jgi:putative peptidoglycan lipid II flippase